MIEKIEIFIACFVALFVVLDAIGNIPLFYSLNSRYSEKNRHGNVRRAILIATIILLPFLFFGPRIMSFFGISISGFKIAGGIILFIIGIKTVLGIELTKKEEYSDIAAVPMATPLIAGPGTITTVMILAGAYGSLIPFLALSANLLVNFLILTYSENIINLMGKQGSDVISRIMGMILVAIAAELVIRGFGGFLAPGIINLS